LHASPSGDGIIAGLQVLACMVQEQKKLSVLAAGVQKLPQLMINVPLKERVDIDANGAIQDAVAQTELELGENGRVLLRPSGTEPLVRVMVEGKDTVQVKDACESLAAAVRDILG
jgi:phosphoglucosamine mutase